MLGWVVQLRIRELAGSGRRRASGLTSRDGVAKMGGLGVFNLVSREIYGVKNRIVKGGLGM